MSINQTTDDNYDESRKVPINGASAFLIFVIILFALWLYNWPKTGGEPCGCGNTTEISK